MGMVEDRLKDIGDKLPPAKTPVANYLGCKQSGDMLYVSARVSQARGEVGTDIDLAAAQRAAKSAMLDILAIVKDAIGNLDRIASVEKLVGFVRTSREFTEHHKVIDGASDLLVTLFGDDGRHARTATGVAQLPNGAAVQIEMVVRLHAESPT